jgi:hypothetical protein
MRKRKFVPNVDRLETKLVLTASASFTATVSSLVSAVDAAYPSGATADQLTALPTVVVPQASNEATTSVALIYVHATTDDVTLWAENVAGAVEDYTFGTTSNPDFTPTLSVSVGNIGAEYTATSGYGADVYFCYDGTNPIDTTLDPVGANPTGPPAEPGTWSQNNSSYYQNNLQQSDLYGDPWT